MAAVHRGPLLTTFAISFALLALSNLLKPLQLEGPTTGFVFLGQRMIGFWNAVLGPLFGIYLAVYACGIIRMRRFAQLPTRTSYSGPAIFPALEVPESS